MIEAQQLAHPVDSLQQVVSIEELGQAQTAVRHVTVTAELKRYILELVTATRRHEDVYVGASPRGSLALFRTAQARAAVSGRDYVVPDDVKALAVPALAHRLIVGSAARVRDVDTRAIIQEIVHSLPVPGGEIGR